MHNSNLKPIRIEYIFYFTLFISAIFSLGYHHPDEHYQIIEFAKMKSGAIATKDLAWEYNAGIRPMLQPLICYITFQIPSFFGINDPYQLSLFLRLLTALYTAIAVSSFVKNTSHLVDPSLMLTYKMLSYFLWFIPFIGVRFSSETWAGLSFILALAFFLKKTDSKKDFIIACIFLSLSFQFRYQSAFLIMGFLAWSIFINKIAWKRISLMFFIFLITTGWALMIDRWFYGHYQLTFWNYFSANILQDIASRFGTSPWYEIIKYAIFAPTWPIGLSIVVSVLILALTDYKSVFLWCLIPFVVVHMMIPHKEIRFLFPIIWLIPIILMLSYQKLKQLNFGFISIVKSRKVFRILHPAILFLMVSINLVALVISITKPAGTGSKLLTKHISEKFKGEKVTLLYTPGNNPYRPWSSLIESFYANKNVIAKEISSASEVKSDTSEKNTILMVCVDEIEAEQFVQDCKFYDKEAFIEVQGSPEWSQKLLRFYKSPTDKNLVLLRVVDHTYL